MATIEEQERAYNQSLPGIFGQYVKSIILSDVEGKLKFLEFVQQVFAMPNLTIEQKITLIDTNIPMQIGMSLPAASVLDVSPLGVEEARLKMSMTVRQSEMSVSGVDAKVEAGAEFSAGIGPFKVGGHMSASVATKSENKRETDRSATTDAEIVLRRQPIPETLSKIMDMLGDVAKQTMDLNQQLIARQQAKITEEIAALPEPEPEAQRQAA